MNTAVFGLIHSSFVFSLENKTGTAGYGYFDYRNFGPLDVPPVHTGIPFVPYPFLSRLIFSGLLKRRTAEKRYFV